MRPSHWMDGAIGDSWDADDITTGVEECPSFRQLFRQGIDVEFQWEGESSQTSVVQCSSVEREIRIASWTTSKPKARRKSDTFHSLYLSLSMPR
jgi:hypothetical protein